MKLAGDFFDEALRRALRQQVGFTVPAAHVNEVVDLGCHAAEQALDTLERLCFGQPNGSVAITSSSIAISILIHRLGELKDAMHAMAQQRGMPVHHANVTVQR